MQTKLADFIRNTRDGQAAENILRNCVHCGFCTATCPTYQLLGDELDGPRGRIYLIKQVLEGEPATVLTQRHLDRCLTCRSCESTCPSGVRYGHLVDIGRRVVEAQVPRAVPERVMRWSMRQVFASPALFGTVMALGAAFKPLLPARLRAMLHTPAAAGAWPDRRHSRRMAVLPGCVQSAMAPRINAAAARVLDALGISLEARAGSSCCGAIDHHLSAESAALNHVRRNVDAWSSALDEGLEAIVMTASGCGAMVKDYAHLLADDPDYAERAARVVAHTRDLAEVLAEADLESVDWQGLDTRRAVFHPPCTLQHGQQIRGVAETILRRVGITLLPVADPHLCCGSAGTYSILQREIAEALRDNKLANLEAGEPSEILSANIGCLHHLQAGTQRTVRHWIEALDEALPKPVASPPQRGAGGDH